jgi:hypothetical protein
MANTGEWQPIETAPRDGSVVRVKRVYQGRVIAEGDAVFGVAHPAAPQRQSLGPDPLGRLSAADYEAEDAATIAYADKPKWLKPDRMCSFPEPTHWLPAERKPNLTHRISTAD